LKLSLARLYSDSVYYDRAQEFNDPNFGFSESCTKKNALNKLARMSRVRHNAKSIEDRYNSFKIFTKFFETFCPLHERPRHFRKIKQLINILFCGYQSTIREKCEPKPILACGTGAPASNNYACADICTEVKFITLRPKGSWFSIVLDPIVNRENMQFQQTIYIRLVFAQSFSVLEEKLIILQLKSWSLWLLKKFFDTPNN
jgi:hypothetical protein